MKAIELQAITFTCIITSDLVNFNNYDYAIEIFEQNDYVIAIKDCKNIFNKEIAPKMMKIMKENQKIEMEKEFLNKFS